MHENMDEILVNAFKNDVSSIVKDNNSLAFLSNVHKNEGIFRDLLSVALSEKNKYICAPEYDRIDIALLNKDNHTLDCILELKALFLTEAKAKSDKKLDAFESIKKDFIKRKEAIMNYREKQPEKYEQRKDYKAIYGILIVTERTRTSTKEIDTIKKVSEEYPEIAYPNLFTDKYLKIPSEKYISEMTSRVHTAFPDEHFEIITKTPISLESGKYRDINVNFHIYIIKQNNLM